MAASVAVPVDAALLDPSGMLFSETLEVLLFGVAMVAGFACGDVLCCGRNVDAAWSHLD